MQKLPFLSLLSFSLVLGASTCLYAQEGGEAAAAAVPLQKKYETSINALAKRPEVKKAYQAILDLEPETRRDHILLTEIPAPPFKEQERAKQYAAMLRQAGADSVWIDAVGNVLAKRKGRSGKRTVVLEGHLDTVFPEGTDVKVKQKGDTLFAPGIGDDTRGLALVLTVLKAMEKTNIQTEADVLFIGTVGEEGLGDLRGVKHLFRPGAPKIDAYIAVDGTNANRVTHRGLGSHRYRITFKGPGGHSSGAFGIGNPHNALGRAIHYFAVEADKLVRSPGVRTTYNVGLVGGGTSVNSIPFESWMEVDMRSESPERLNSIDKLLQAAVQKALQEENQMKQRGPALTVEVKSVGDRPSGSLDANLPLVQQTMAVIKSRQGQPQLGVGSTNSNTPIALGVPAVTIGAGGSSGDAHALSEWWKNDKGHEAIQQALLLVLAQAGLAK
jgi:tripeptide aminopeptidase